MNENTCTVRKFHTEEEICSLNNSCAIYVKALKALNHLNPIWLSGVLQFARLIQYIMSYYFKADVTGFDTINHKPKVLSITFY